MEPVSRRSGPWRYTSCTTSYSNGSRWMWWPSMQPSVQQRLESDATNGRYHPKPRGENHQKMWFRCSWFWTSEIMAFSLVLHVFYFERMVVLPLKIVVLGPQLELLSWRFSTSNSDYCKPNAINLLFAGDGLKTIHCWLIGAGLCLLATFVGFNMFQLSKNPKMEDTNPKIED